MCVCVCGHQMRSGGRRISHGRCHMNNDLFSANPREKHTPKHLFNINPPHFLLSSSLFFLYINPSSSSHLVHCSSKNEYFYSFFLVFLPPRCSTNGFWCCEGCGWGWIICEAQFRLWICYNGRNGISWTRSKFGITSLKFRRSIRATLFLPQGNFNPLAFWFLFLG